MKRKLIILSAIIFIIVLFENISFRLNVYNSYKFEEKNFWVLNERIENNVSDSGYNFKIYDYILD